MSGEHLPEHATADAASALDVAGIAAVLAGHPWAVGYGDDRWCACGWKPERPAAGAHKMHVAEAVAAHVEALREADRAAAWDEGYREAIEDYGTDIPWGGLTSDHNPYRSES